MDTFKRKTGRKWEKETEKINTGSNCERKLEIILEIKENDSVLSIQSMSDCYTFSHEFP